MKWLLPVLIIIFVMVTSCNGESSRKRAEIDQKLEYFEMKIETLNRRIDAFNPNSLPLDYTMKVYEDLNTDFDSLKNEIDVYGETLFGEDIFSKHPISTEKQRDKYMEILEQLIELLDRMEEITLAFHYRIQ